MSLSGPDTLDHARHCLQCGTTLDWTLDCRQHGRQPAREPAPHGTRQTSYRFRASSRPDSQHQQAPRPPLHPAPARNRQRHRDVASILLDDRYRLVESTSRYADARWSALWLMRFFGRLLVIIYNRTSVDESTRSRSRPRAVGGAPCADHVVGRSPAPVLTSFYPLFPARAGNNSVSFGLWRRTIYVQLYARRRGGDAGRAGN